MELLILTPAESKRVEYIFRLIFNDLLETKFRITFSDEEFKNYNGPKINYTALNYSDAVNIFPDSLLFEKNIKPQNFNTVIYQDINCIFKCGADWSDMPFDIFAAVFYLVTRYEEYLPYKPDKYGRFEAEESVAFRLKFIDKPVVNIWVKDLENIVNRKFPGTIKTTSTFSFVSTYDIDIAFAYLGKPIIRLIAASIKDLFSGHLNNFKTRLNVLLHKENDPYDSFDYILSVHKKLDIKSVFFIHPGTYGKVDKNIPLSNKNIKSVIDRISKISEIGLHPSYRSVNEKKLLQKEISKLEFVTGKKIIIARQHFIYLKFPETYRNYINSGISQDYSIGYASKTGFRAGICSPFYFYDLKEEEETNLQLFPFAFMDGACKNYMQLSNDETKSHISNLIDEVKKVNGTFISLWHNESLAETPLWKGWRKVYEFMIEKAL